MNFPPNYNDEKSRLIPPKGWRIGAAEIKMPLLKFSLGSAGSISAGTGLETPETGN